MVDERLLEGIDIFVNEVPTDGANVDVVTHWDYCTSLMLTLDQLRVILPSTLLQKDVRTGCPGTPSEGLVRLIVLYNLPSWEFFLK